MKAIPRLVVLPVMVYGLAEGLIRALNLAFLPLLTKLFSIEQFGQIALLSTVMSLVGLLANCGLGNAVHRFYFEPVATPGTRRGFISAGFWTLLAMCTGLVVATFTLFWGVPIIASFALPHISIPLSFCLLAVIPIQLVQFGQDVLRLYSAHWQYFFISVLKTVAAFAIGLGLVYWFEAGVAGYFFGLLAAQLLLLGWVVVSLADSLKVRPAVGQVALMVRYGAPFVVAGLAQWLMSSSDLWVLGVLAGAADVGIYSLCLKLASIVSFVTTAFGLAWSPQVLRMHLEDADYRSIAGNTLLQLAAFLIFFATSVAAMVPYLFVWLIPPQYGKPFFMITILSFSSAILGTCQVTILGMVFEKRSDLIAKINWAVAIVSIGVSWCLVSILGIWGAAVSNLLASVLLTGSYFVVTHRIHSLLYSPKEIRFLLIFSAACILAVAGMGLVDESVQSLSVKILILGVLFLWMWKSGRWGRFFVRNRVGE